MTKCDKCNSAMEVVDKEGVDEYTIVCPACNHKVEFKEACAEVVASNGHYCLCVIPERAGEIDFVFKKHNTDKGAHTITLTLDELHNLIESLENKYLISCLIRK